MSHWKDQLEFLKVTQFSRYPEKPGPEAHHTAYVDRVERRMICFDEQPEPIKQLLRDYDQNVIDAFLACGIENPKHVRHLIKTVTEWVKGSSYGNGSRRGLQPPK